MLNNGARNTPTRNRNNYTMGLFTDKQRDALRGYPLYSQDGKKGEAVAVVRLFITGTAATFYILESNLETGELFGVSNMEQGEGWTYGYFSIEELESLDMYGGAVHTEVDTHFTPAKLKDIPELAEGLAWLWGDDDNS